MAEKSNSRLAAACRLLRVGAATLFIGLPGIVLMRFWVMAVAEELKHDNRTASRPM